MTSSLLGQASLTVLFVSIAFLLYSPIKSLSLMGLIGTAGSIFSLAFCCAGFLPSNKVIYPPGSCLKYQSKNVFTRPGFFKIDSYADHNWIVHITIFPDTKEGKTKEMFIDHSALYDITSNASIDVVDCKVATLTEKGTK